MYIGETYKRRVRIEGKPEGTNGFHLSIHDLDTGALIGNVADATIYLCPGELNRADLTYFKSDENGNIEHDPDDYFKPIKGTVHIDNPEISLSAYERMQPGEDEHANIQ